MVETNGDKRPKKAEQTIEKGQQKGKKCPKCGSLTGKGHKRNENDRKGPGCFTCAN